MIDALGEEALPADPSPTPRAPLIEIGWVLHGRLDEADLKALAEARKQMRHLLRSYFPEYEWRMPLSVREDPTTEHRRAPVDLLDVGETEREVRHWDFALVISGADFESHYKPFALGIPSRTLGVALLSTFRIDPQARRVAIRRERITVMTQRALALAMHMFGHLNGLAHSDDREDFMYDLGAIRELDGMRRLGSESLDQLHAELAHVADTRLEERTGSEGLSGAGFYLRASASHVREVVSMVRQARPWEFPLRLSRLTTAAISTMLIMLMTAEAWELGMSQEPGFMLGFSAATILGTSLYILRRQGLLVRRDHQNLSEQTVVTNLSVTVIVVLGMMSTYALVFVLTLLLGLVLHGEPLLMEWAPSLGGRITFGHRLLLAEFVATLGVLIGALGASFEGQRYFRHVAYVDEET